MSAIVQSPRAPASNRRRSVRQKVHAPAYASFAGSARSEMLDLYEVLDISETGVALQCPTPVEVNQQVELCLDLAESDEQLCATARVVWSDGVGRVGLGFPPLPEPALQRLRGWLFLNAMAGAANAASSLSAPSLVRERSVVRPDYSGTLAAASAVESEAESLGPDIEAVLSLIALRTYSILRASGAAIALAADNADSMICRASAGRSAPPVGATLQVGSGFSGECVRTGKMLRCDDAEIDELVDPDSCRALGIRSLLAVPIKTGDKVIGLLEAFSDKANIFSENDSSILRRFAEAVSRAVDRAAPPDDSSVPPEMPAKGFVPNANSILFAAEPEPGEKKLSVNESRLAGMHLPRGRLYLLYSVAATVALVLGFMLAPWLEEKLQNRERNQVRTVLASSAALPPSRSAPIDSANLDQLRDLARHGNPAAENALGLLYAQGDEKQSISQDEIQAANWFTKAADDGSIPAQYKLSLLYWGGHGVPKDVRKAYFWAVLARAGGNEGSKDLAKVLANGMNRSQAAAIEQQAEIWYQQHASYSKPKPGR